MEHALKSKANLNFVPNSAKQPFRALPHVYIELVKLHPVHSVPAFQRTLSLSLRGHARVLYRPRLSYMRTTRPLYYTARGKLAATEG